MPASLPKVGESTRTTNVPRQEQQNVARKITDRELLGKKGEQDGGGGRTDMPKTRHSMKPPTSEHAIHNAHGGGAR